MYRLGQQTGKGSQRDRERSAEQAETYHGSAGGRITGAAPLPGPVEGVLKENQEPVTFLQTCNWDLHSPSLIGTDAQGEFFVSSFEESRATDQRIVPNEKLRQLRQGTMPAIVR
jgi:hypothetical protein